MAQTRKISFVESWTNVAVGWTINYFANLAIFPLFGMHISAKNNLFMGSIYTLISVVRSYTIRRWFNSKEAKKPASAAKGFRQAEILTEAEYWEPTLRDTGFTDPPSLR